MPKPWWDSVRAIIEYKRWIMAKESILSVSPDDSTIASSQDRKKRALWIAFIHHLKNESLSWLCIRLVGTFFPTKKDLKKKQYGSSRLQVLRTSRHASVELEHKRKGEKQGAVRRRHRRARFLFFLRFLQHRETNKRNRSLDGEKKAPPAVPTTEQRPMGA